MRVLYAGSFDPFHRGHRSVVERAAASFDEVVVAAIGNPAKPTGTPLDERAAAIGLAVADLERVRVTWYAGLTIDLARHLGVDALLRGAVRDHRLELEMAHMNLRAGGIPTIFLAADGATRHISSTAIRAGDLPDDAAASTG